MAIESRCVMRFSWRQPLFNRSNKFNRINTLLKVFTQLPDSIRLLPLSEAVFTE